MYLLVPTIYPVTSHTDHVGVGTTFVAIDGYQTNGAKYVEVAIKKGATEIVSEVDLSLDRKYPNVKFRVVSDARLELARLSASRLNNPASKFKIIGITGTKGKTTTAFLIDCILDNVAMLGTIRNKILDEYESATLTTPGADTLHMFFDQCVKKGVEHVVMEVSSHSLSLNRVHGIEFDVACFTNLSSEHMDFYSSMEEYFNAKKKLFLQLKHDGVAIINKDDAYGSRIKKGACLDFKVISNNINGLSIEIDGDIIESKMLGEFNAYNIAMAYRVARALDVKSDVIASRIKSFSGVPGRLQRHTLKNGARAFVDYAHNPSSMDSVLKTLRPLTDHLIVVFGCGGDRDSLKRPDMGKAADDYADEIIITNDNPRFENPQNIIRDIQKGILHNSPIIEMDRGAAIERAVSLSQSSSIVAILGKGHEDYYLVDGKKLFFDDFKEVCRY